MAIKGSGYMAPRSVELGGRKNTEVEIVEREEMVHKFKIILHDSNEL